MKQTARTFKALSDQTRLRILLLLLEGELCVCEIIAALELPQSTISRHLAYLKKSFLVLDRKQGAWMYYRLNRGQEKLIDTLIDILRSTLSENRDVALAFAKLEDFRRVHLQQGPA